MEVKLKDPYGLNPGPIDDFVLSDQEKHVSSAVWDGQERTALRCHEHTSKLEEWMLTPKQVELVERAGFGFLRLIPAIGLNKALISALVESWRRETNTFHFSVGEMTVTLKDVVLILGLAIDGEPVTGTTYTTSHSVCKKYLGVAPEPGYTNGGMVKLTWLKQFFSQCPEDASPEVIERHTRAYLLYLVGCTIFSTTTGNKVPVMYLPLFENFDQCGKYAWGAAALAFLYRSLGNASKSSQSTISGCLTLLQCWSYFHLNIGRPLVDIDTAHDCFPFVLRWKGKLSDPTTDFDVLFYRQALNSLKPNDVEWLPYESLDNNVIPLQIKSNLILGRSKTMLICFDKAERHLPNRCLRQYGMVQSIPENVEHWKRKNRGIDDGVDLSEKMQSEISEWSQRGLCIVQCDVGADEGDYMNWYLKITRKFVERPILLSEEFQAAIAGLRDVACIADAFPTEGLDPQQIELIHRIRCIAHECHREQVGGTAVMYTNPQVKVGKRIRGKEMVNLQKDDLMPLPYNAASNIEQEDLQDGIAVENGSKCNSEQEDTQNLQYGMTIDIAGLPNNEQEDIQNLPFVKSSPIWQILESMEVFGQIPQKPHFRPLAKCNEIKREGVAIAKMMTFASLLEKTSRLKEDDLGESFDSIIEELVALEELGFDIKVPKGRLNKLLQMKMKLEKLQDVSKVVGTRIKENKDKRTEIDEEVAEINKEIKRLEEKRAFLISESIDRGSRIRELLSEAAAINEGVLTTQRRFKSLLMMNSL